MLWRLTTHPGQRRSPRGFTLVELLVVISIIALLISILLPSLSKAREQAKTVVCATRIKGILTAMATYATEYDDYIAGSPNTSGSALFGPEAVNIAGLREHWTIDPIQAWDWAGGMFRQFNMKVSATRWEERFQGLRRMKAFMCPSIKKNLLIPAYLPAWDAGPALLMSYNTCRTFMWPADLGLMSAAFPDPRGRGPYNRLWGQRGLGYQWRVRNIQEQLDEQWDEKPRPGYIPRTDMVGTPADKVFIADGARFVTTQIEADYDGNPYARYGGAFADVGPYSDFSRSWDRTAPEKLTSAQRDPRVYSYRHGKKQSFLPLGNYKMNMGFFDGHVDLKNDLNSANPHHWMPKGFLLTNATTVLRDVREKYFPDEEDLRIR